MGAGLNGGIALKPYDRRSCVQTTGGVSVGPGMGVGGYGQIGNRVGPDITDMELGVSAGTPGFTFGPMFYKGGQCKW